MNPINEERGRFLEFVTHPVTTPPYRQNIRMNIHFLPNDPEPASMPTVSLAATVGLLFFRIYHMAYTLSCASAGQLLPLKADYCTLSELNQFLIVFVNSRDLRFRDPLLSRTSEAFKNVLPHLLKVLLTEAHNHIGLERSVQNLPDATRANVRVPVTILDPNGFSQVIGYRRFDPVTSRDAVEMLNTIKFADRLLVTRGERPRPIIVGVSEQFFQFLALRILHVIREKKLPNGVVTSSDIEAAFSEGSIGHLLRLEKIPEELVEDSFFDRHFCSMTYHPIRRVVNDPTVGKLRDYERAALKAFLIVNGVSPLTGRELLPNQVVEVKVAQEGIDARLSWYSEKLKELLLEIVTPPRSSLIRPTPVPLTQRLLGLFASER